MDELLQLTRENNEMLAEILRYVRMVQSPEYQEQRQLVSFLINCVANEAGELKERMQQGNNNNQFFRR